MDSLGRQGCSPAAVSQYFFLVWGCNICLYRKSNLCLSEQQTKYLERIFSFAASRVITLLLDMFIMYLGASVMEIDYNMVKLISMVLVTAGNYVISKFWVFRI